MLLNLFQEKKWPIAPGLNASSDSDSKIAVAQSPKSGLVGRPSSKDLYLKKLKQRALAGELASSLKEEADFLLGWLKTAHPEHPASGASAIRNLIREDYRHAKSKT